MRRVSSIPMRISAVLFAMLSVSATAEVPYTIIILGVSDRELIERLEEISTTSSLRKSPPASNAQLQRRIDDDIPRLKEELRARAYYNAEIEVEVDTDTSPAKVEFHIKTGETYRIKDVTLTMIPVEGHDPPTIITILKPGKAGAAGKIIDEEERLIRAMQTLGYPFASKKDRRVIVDHDNESVSVEWTFELGPKVRFGPVIVDGLTSVRQSLIHRLVPWKRGDWYNVHRIDRLEKHLMRSAIFSRVEIVVEGKFNPGDEVPVQIHVQERKHRTIRIGAAYRSDTGVGAIVSWEHRNLFRTGERIEFELGISEILVGGEVRFSKPGVLRHDQRILAEQKFFQEDTDAFKNEVIESVVGMERAIENEIRALVGIGYKYDDVQQQKDSEIFGLIFLPIRMDWNPSDSLLDPTSGWRLILEGTPYADTKGKDVVWFRSFAEYRQYLGITRRPQIILAARVAGGTLTGEGRDDIPADERFYAGGGGSIRGYEFQSVGPLAADGTPLGGDTLIEASIEIRARFGESFGAVGFLDGGNVFRNGWPDEDEDIRWGVGAGLRYYTAIGPIRADVAFPLNRRDQIDDSYQFYISLGQAF
jgi:translocation and assembly module TamA